MVVSAAAGGGLTAHTVSRHFYQLRAVEEVTLGLQRGEILGLIGPNGSGKTTLINVITGVLPATAGRVTVDGIDITGWKAYRIARVGLARTFQRVRLFGGLSVLENIVVAAISVGLSRRKAMREAQTLLEEFGLERWSDREAVALPYGHERLVEVLRALAMRPKYLFLDEPAAGLNEDESEDLLRRLSPLPRERGLGILIVDHDIHLIMRLCHRLHVLNYGQTIAEGTPEEVRRVPQVIEAYLGTSAADDIHARA